MLGGARVQSRETAHAPDKLAVRFRIVSRPSPKTKTCELRIQVVMKTDESPLRFFARILGRKSFAVHVDNTIALLEGLCSPKERTRQQGERKELREMIQPNATPGPHSFSFLPREG